MPAHRILGACNPSLAYRALQAEPDIGLLQEVGQVAQEARERLLRASTSL